MPHAFNTRLGRRTGALTTGPDTAAEPDEVQRLSFRRRWLSVPLVMALVATGILFNVFGLRDTYEQASRDVGITFLLPDRDSDGDGLFDHVERSGWGTSGDGTHVTDPKRWDTDGDGLSDGQEAGRLISSSEGDGDATFLGIADPTEADTDGDGIGDGDEYFLDLDLRSRDTDDDGLPDGPELEFGSDPTVDNLDGDSYSDREELERKSDPSSYDLDRSEAVAAFLGGATAGDWRWAARHIGGLNDDQLESPEYLAGQIAAGAAGIGDLRDFVANMGSLNVVDALTSLVGVAPGPGDLAKTSALIVAFAERSEPAINAASRVIRRLPWPEASKKKVLKSIVGTSTRLPLELGGGPKNYVVYIGSSTDDSGYVGITNNFLRRRTEHAGASRTFAPEPIEGAVRLSRGEARAIEEACIVELGLKSDGGSLQNQIHSISPTVPYYDAAVAWGTEHLNEIGGRCS